MNQEEIQQAARKEKWVPKADRVKIRSTNMRIDPTMIQKEETYQVILHVIKKTSFYRAFLSSADVPEIYMQQLRHTVTKVKESTFYEIKMANKKCLVDVEVFCHALNICPRVLGKEFIVPPSEEELLTFLIGLGIGEDIQEYGRAIPDAMLTDDIKQSETYQMFIKYSTGLIPPNKTREEAARQVHDNHERIVTKSDPEPARRRPSGIAYRDTSSVSNKMSHDPSQKLEGVQTLTPEEQLVADMMQALKASKRPSRSLPPTRVSSEGTGVSPGVPIESTIILTTSNEGTGTKPGGSEKESEYSEEEKVEEEIDRVYSGEVKEKKDNDNDDKSIDIEKTNDEETDDEIIRCDEYVQEHVDEEMKDAKDSANAEINSLLDVQYQQEIPQTRSPLILIVPVSVIFEPAVLLPIPEIPIVSLATTPPPPHFVSTISHILQQTTTPIPTPLITTEAPPITTIALVVTMIPDPPHAINQRVSVLEKDVQELKAVDHTTTLLALLKSEIPLAVNPYLRSSLGDALQKVLRKYAQELKQQYSQQVDYKNVIEESVQANIINEFKNLLPKFLPKTISDFATLVIQSTVAESLSKYELKTIIFDNMGKSRSYLTHDKHQKILRKRDHDDDDKDEDPSAGPNQDTKTKRRRTKESKSSKKSSATKETFKGNDLTKDSKSDKAVYVEESAANPTKEVIMDTSIDDVVNDADQPQKDSVPKHEWFKQPSWTTTLDPKWNMHQVINDQPQQPWFNNMVFAANDTLTFDDLMATPINFSMFVMNHLKIDKLTKAHLILSVLSLKIKKLHGYGHLEEIVVRRADRQKYKFKEDDYVNLNLNYIDDMLHFIAQHKLFNLVGNDIVDLEVALRMFNRSLIIKRRVKDVQLGVESYQKKLKLTKPQQDFPGISAK
ncbi:hypothetical protein Tco_1568301 [Tanacetum coccineum]